MTGQTPFEVYRMTLSEAALMTEAAELKMSRDWDHTALITSVMSRLWAGKKGKNPDYFHPMKKRRARNIDPEDRRKIVETFSIDTIENDAIAIRKRRESGKRIDLSMQLFRRKWRLSPEVAEDIVEGRIMITDAMKMRIRANMEEKANGT